MDPRVSDALVLAVLDCLRGRLSDATPWPQGEAYRVLCAGAAALVAAVGAAAEAATVAAPGSGETPSDPDPGESSAGDPLPEPVGFTPLRPGVIPETAPPRTARAPVRLSVDIERNAREGEPYRSAITVWAADGRPAAILACAIPPAAGIAFDGDCLTGADPRAGEYVICLTCTLDGADADAGRSAEAVLVVNPDPRTLWKCRESDRDAPGWKPDHAGEQLAGAGGRHILTASRRGRAHAHTGCFRDDDCAVRVTGPDGWNLVAVADGAGSARRSRIGSRVAANTAVAVAAARLEAAPEDWPLAALRAQPQDLGGARTAAYHMLGAAAFEAVKAIEAKAREQGFEVRDYATTLLLAAHRPLGEYDLVATYWVGDGAIGLVHTTHDVSLLGQPDSGDFAGQTRFLERDLMADGTQIMNRIQVAVVPRFAGLVLMTDGVSDAWFPSATALREPVHWERLWQDLAPVLTRPDAPAQLLEWLGFWSSGNHDDRTLAVIW